MFAFGLYDAKKRPFFWHGIGLEKNLCSTGTSQASLSLPPSSADPAFSRQLDMQSLNYYLAYGYVPGSMCIFKGVYKLPQGHALVYNLRTQQLLVWHYWQLPEPHPDVGASSDDLITELERLLQDSVRLRLIADVLVGILLSGGIDSSLVTAMAVRASSKPVKTFTIPSGSA